MTALSKFRLEAPSLFSISYKEMTGVADIIASGCYLTDITEWFLSQGSTMPFQLRYAFRGVQLTDLQSELLALSKY